jgi:hypothetical protein
MDYLQDAINKIDQSEGDCTNNYQEVLVRQAELRLQLSVAQSLAEIVKQLKELNRQVNTIMLVEKKKI